MSFNAFSNTSLTTLATDTQKSGAHEYKMIFKGLRPSTKHRLYLEDEDYTWACRGWGQNLGEEIVSDEFGVARVFVYYEIYASRPAQFEYKTTESVAFHSNKLSKQNARMEDAVIVNYKTWEIKSADGLSQAVFHMHFHEPMINGDYNRIEQHD